MVRAANSSAVADSMYVDSNMLEHNNSLNDTKFWKVATDNVQSVP
jgi:hypothetical protein